MELRNKEELRNEILQSWLRNAWVYPLQGPDNRTYLRLTPGGRLKMRRKIGELEETLGVKGGDLARQEEVGALPAERNRRCAPRFRSDSSVHVQRRAKPTSAAREAEGEGFEPSRGLHP